LQTGLRRAAAAPPHLRPADQLPDRAARHRAPAPDPDPIAQRHRHRCAGRRPQRRLDPPHPPPRRLTPRPLDRDRNYVSGTPALRKPTKKVFSNKVWISRTPQLPDTPKPPTALRRAILEKLSPPSSSRASVSSAAARSASPPSP